jgi:hypothetical protein
VTADAPKAKVLIEQVGRFDYDYRMRCPNGHISHVRSTLFLAESIVEDGSAPCQACGVGIAVVNENIVVRNPDDPSLDRNRVSDLAWYHTSTYPEWPPPDYAEVIADQLQPSPNMMPPRVFAEMVHREQTKALHLGTYESAIENMHRRMRNQDDAHTQFYLHHVSVNLAAGEVEPDVKHESHEEASQLTLDDLADFKAVRYLNVEESAGSISLAVAPSAIASIQTLPLPATFLAAPPSPRMTEAATRLNSELEEIDAQLQALPNYDFTTGVVLRRQGDAEAIRVRQLGRRRWDARQQFTQQLADTCVPDLNPIVREHFTDAIAWPAGESAESFHNSFRAQAAALSYGGELITELAQHPWSSPPTAT